MDNITVTALLLVLVLIVIISIIAMSKPGRRSVISLKNQWLGEVSAEAEHSQPQIITRAEQIVEDSPHASQEMSAASQGKQVAKNSPNSRQKIT